MNKYTVKICDEEVEIRKSRVTAIKAYCLDCSAGQKREIKNCPCTMCPLYIYRGYSSEGKKAISEEQMVNLRATALKNLKFTKKSPVK